MPLKKLCFLILYHDFHTIVNRICDFFQILYKRKAKPKSFAERLNFKLFQNQSIRNFEYNPFLRNEEFVFRDAIKRNKW